MVEGKALWRPLGLCGCLRRSLQTGSDQSGSLFVRRAQPSLAGPRRVDKPLVVTLLTG